MPKKTKREKIIAEYRRKLSAVSSRQLVTPSAVERHSEPNLPLSKPTFAIPTALPKNESRDAITLDPEEFLAIKKDLIITLGLTLSILIGQIVLWRVMG